MPRHATSHLMQRTCSAILLLIAATVCCLPAALSQTVPGCTSPSGPPRNRTVNVAIMFWGPPTGIRQEVWNRNPLLDEFNGTNANDQMQLQSYLLWEERIALPAAHGGGPGLILLDGSVMRFNLTWFHSGGINDVSLVDEYDSAIIGSWPDTLVKRLANATGPYGRQHFIITPTPQAAITMLASLACEASHSCIAVTIAAANARMFECQDPMPIDCSARHLLKSSRRFEFTVSAASNGNYWGGGSLVFAVNQGLKRVFIIAEPWAAPIVHQLGITAAQLNLQLVGVQMVEAFGSDWAALNTSTAEVTERMQNTNVDLVIVLSGFPTPTITQLIEFWRATDYLPAAVSVLAGGPAYIPEDLRGYFLIETFWIPQLTGPSFRALDSEANFETFPANDTNDSPAIFADAFQERFNVQLSLVTSYQAARAFHAISIVQKLLELAQSEDTEALRYASTRVATPGVYHAIQFDQWGRSMPTDNYVLQLMPDGSTRILTPLGLGAAPIIPMPNWSEREYKPVFLAKTSDRVAFALAAVTVLYLLGWIVWLILHWQHPLILVAGPLANVLSLCGLIVLVSSNFWSTYQESTSTCRANTWLSILGLTLGFAPLVLKNLRIWSLWQNSKSFNPAPIRQKHTVSALIVLLLIDVALLAAWQARTGLLAYRVSPDPNRPALDYHVCDIYRHSRSFVIAAMSWKLLMLALAMYLAYLLRDVPSRFSESRFIALCVYNVTIVLAVLVPVTATNAAGHEGTQLVRNFLIIFLCVTTASLMFVPKVVAVGRRVRRKGGPPSWRIENDSESPVGLEPQQQPHLPALEPPPHDSQPTQRPATDPGQGAVSVVHSAHFPVSAPAPIARQHIDFRTPEWPPAQLPTFQSMLGLSQIEQRYAEGDSELPRSNAAQSHSASRSNRLHSAPIGPQLVLPAIPQSPRDDQSRSSSDPAADVLQATVELVNGMPADELVQLRSFLRQRYLPTPSDDRRTPPSVFASAVAPAAASASAPVLIHGAGLGSGKLLSVGAARSRVPSTSVAVTTPEHLADSSEDETISFYDA